MCDLKQSHHSDEIRWVRNSSFISFAPVPLLFEAVPTGVQVCRSIPQEQHRLFFGFKCYSAQK